MTTKTGFILDREYVNIKPATVWTLIAPDDWQTKTKMPLTRSLKELFQHSGITWVKEIETRNLESGSFEILDITIYRSNDPLEYYFIGDNEKSNGLSYRRIKKELVSEGYQVKHTTCKEERDCSKQYYAQARIEELPEDLQ